MALYSDKHSIFRVDAAERGGELTQFTRALTAPDIEAIHAHTPQAKGRVERANKTLQDRLVKEMRRAGTDDIATANAWLPTFVELIQRPLRQGLANSPAMPTAPCCMTQRSWIKSSATSTPASCRRT